MLTCLLAPLHAATVDDLGAEDRYNNESEEVKGIVFTADEAAVITELEFALYGWGEGAVEIVLYQEQRDGSFSLVEDVEGQGVPSNGAGYASTGTIAWLLEPGETYLFGAWLADYYYYYGTETADPWFGTVAASAQVSAEGGPPATLEPVLEAYYYRIRVTSEDADVDGDGALAEQWGGDDCDDGDGNIGAPADEVPYDGVDQDCDGLDLTDVDGDGVDGMPAGGQDCDDEDPAVGAPAVEVPYDGVDQDCDGVDVTDVDEDGHDALVVGGDDCDDTTGAVQPSAQDVCGDGIDQDCTGTDLACDDLDDLLDDGPDDGDGASDETVDITAKGCGCATGSAGGAGLLLGVAAIALLGMRRGG